MKLQKEIAKLFPHTCVDCIKRNNCAVKSKYKDDYYCPDYIPESIEDKLQALTKYLICTVPQSKDNKLKRKVQGYYNTYYGIVDDKVTTLDNYYVSFINDCLALLRKGQPAYVFKVEHIRDVLRFERDIKVEYLKDEEMIKLTRKGC